MTNGTVIEISLTCTCPLSSIFSVAENKDRYCNGDPCHTWNHCRSAGYARMPYVSINRIFLGASHHARSIFKNAAGSDSEGSDDKDLSVCLPLHTSSHQENPELLL